jgi:hypothetical protein
MKQIESWLIGNAVFGLKFPDGWFGKPYDNQHRLTWLADRDNKLILELDNQLYLTFTKPIDISKSDSSLIISGFNQAVCDWQGYGELNPNCKLYNSGSITLVSLAY